jgi:hypothetical protein
MATKKAAPKAKKLKKSKKLSKTTTLTVPKLNF